MISNKTQAKLFSCLALGGIAYQAVNKEIGAFPLILSALSTIAATKKWYDVYHSPPPLSPKRYHRRVYQTNSPNPIQLAIQLAEWRKKRR